MKRTRRTGSEDNWTRQAAPRVGTSLADFATGFGGPQRSNCWGILPVGCDTFRFVVMRHAQAGRKAAVGAHPQEGAPRLAAPSDATVIVRPGIGAAQQRPEWGKAAFDGDLQGAVRFVVGMVFAPIFDYLRCRNQLRVAW